MYAHTYLQIEHNAMSDGLDANTFFQAFSVKLYFRLYTLTNKKR